MSATQSYDNRTIKGKRPAHPPPLNPGHSGPTTFFLRSEKDIEQSAQRGRKPMRSSRGTEDSEQLAKTPAASIMGDSSYGVESLADTINSAFASDTGSLSRTNSDSTEPNTEAGAEASNITSRKRKANPVHPKIQATGQRIISSEHLSTQASSAASPVSFRSSESPYRNLRRGSASSSINLSQPLTPLKMSPQPESAMPSTPHSGSPKSFRLSDEEGSVAGSVADEAGSQAIQSSSGEEEELEVSKGRSMPQLVMPSIALPSRRPFTDRGKRMGRLKAMVVGNDGVGKSSLIQSIFRQCQDIVHVDAAPTSPAILLRQGVESSERIVETHASTRPYPPWRSDSGAFGSATRRKSVSDTYDRNLCFIDTPGITEEDGVLQVLKYFNATMLRSLALDKLTESEIVNVLSGEGGVQIDAVLWLFESSIDAKLEGPQRHLFEALCRNTNLIPVIAQADHLFETGAERIKQQVMDTIQETGTETYAFASNDALMQEPLLVSSALSDDAETIDASVLMSSQYMQPLLPSELGSLLEQLLEPDNIARMRYLSATKLLCWRQHHGHMIDLQKQTLLNRSPQFGHTLPSVTSTGSLLEEPSKVLVPHSTSSYYRSTSPAASDSSALFGQPASTYALERYNEKTQGGVPFRQVRLAKWAQDLQRSLDNERRRYKQMYLNTPSDWQQQASDTDTEKNPTEDKALIPHNQRPSRGRLGGDVAIIDPRDPLGVLAFSQAFRRRGYFALRITAGCGLVGAVAWWVMRNWVEVQERFGFGQPAMILPTPVVAPPNRGMMGWLGLEEPWKGFFG